ncbi:glucan biosynthesis protein D [Jiella sp. 40Bstr34]|uniref:Glucan biosynthesis protein D n=1 Tax=Jiella pacifica TaxID=2696469 RepID=A0A6N9T367_9HYPH|nr:glucan biosynthesis protein D [Jiella pacifica]
MFAVKSPRITSRRSTLKLGVAAACSVALPFSLWNAGKAAAQEASQASSDGEEPAVGTQEQPFTFDTLSAAMEKRAAEAYVAPDATLPDVVANLSYDQHRAIRFRPEQALWRAEPGEFHLQAFYPGWVFKDTTRIFIGNDGIYRQHVFDASDFEYRPPLDPSAFQSLKVDGVAGFRIHAPLQRPDYFDELVTFLGASYFRALGAGSRYGLSARGLAINTATSETEEFPRFSAFYIDQPRPSDGAIRIMAELHSPSLAGAYLFVITPGQTTTIETTCRLYPRTDITRLGIAPLTSMYFFGENDHADHEDFRPEVHDSDGLYIIRATGEEIWRPLKNPQTLALSYIQESSPKAFGLLQRDRNFLNYQDTEARYDLRPSLLIETIGDWGNGTVELVEIPTDSEVNDNIVAFWVPETKAAAGQPMEFSYRMRWGLGTQDPTLMARVSGTYVGVGGNAADAKDNPSSRRFAINFTGGTIHNLPDDAKIDPQIDVPSNARLLDSSVSRLPDGGWRLSLEIEREDSQPVELRVKLSMLQRIVSETWLYQWTSTT